MQRTIKVPEVQHAYLVELPEGVRFNGQVKATHDLFEAQEADSASGYYFTQKHHADMFAVVVGMQAARNGGNARHARKGTRKTRKTARTAKGAK